MNGNFFSDVDGYVENRLADFSGNNKNNSKLSAYVVAANYTNPGLVIKTNPNLSLVGGASVYGTSTTNGDVGTTIGGGVVAPSTTLDQNQGLRPSPIITQLEVNEQNSDDGASNFSRTAKFTIRCFSMGQMEVVVQHFLNPGSSVFLQYGWNDSTAAANVSVANVSKYKNFGNINSFRSTNGGKADVYLGFVVGGDVSMQNDYWDITVNCKGHMELPAWLMVSDNTKGQAKKAAGTEPPPLDYGGTEISDASSPLGLRRWKTCFNQLPSSKKTAKVKGLQNNLADIAYFINFDEEVKDSINSTTKQAWWKIFSAGVDVVFGDAAIELAEDTKLISDERYIMFGALMQIINMGEYEALRLSSGVEVPFKIHSENTFCSAFERIYSHDKTKLFIPNPKTPTADFQVVAAQGGVQTNFNDNFDCRVQTNTGKLIKFPDDATSAVGGHIDNVKAINPGPYTFGKLDFLYVNFDFAKKILETKNLPIKDALYQILNGMSSAAGGIWDFQIVEVSVGGKDRLEILDFNLTGKKQTPKTFQISGVNSPFLEAGLKIDISGQMSNQIMLEKSGASANSSMPPIRGLFVKAGADDMIVEGMKANTSITLGASANTTSPDDETRKKRDFAAFMEKVCLVPQVQLTGPIVWPTDGNWKTITYQTAYDEMNLHETYKQKADAEKETSGDMSILLPIDITLTSLGVSGFKRGDMLRVSALPPQYNSAGFFQVTGVTQNCQDDHWTTTVTGTFRSEHK